MLVRARRESVRSCGGRRVRRAAEASERDDALCDLRISMFLSLGDVSALLAVCADMGNKLGGGLWRRSGLGPCVGGVDGQLAISFGWLAELRNSCAEVFAQGP